MADDINMTVPLDPNDPDNLAKIAAQEDLPGAPPDDVPSSGDHQQKDTNLDPTGVQDVGEDIEANIEDPLRKDPPKDTPAKSSEAEGFDTDEPTEVEF